MDPPARGVMGDNMYPAGSGAPSAPTGGSLMHDHVRAQVAHNYARQDALFHRIMHLPVALAAVSEAVRAILAQQFGRATLLVPNGVDCDRFFPGPPAAVRPTALLAPSGGSPSTSSSSSRAQVDSAPSGARS